MLFKVWAQNCVRPKGMRIIEVFESDLKQEFDKIFDEACDIKLIDPFVYDEDGDMVQVDDEKTSEAYSKIEAYWNKNKEISSGDYMIIEAESKFDIEIPNVCYGDTSIIFQ